MPCGISVLRSPARLDFNPWLTSHALALLTVWLYFDILLYSCCARKLPSRVTLTPPFCTLAGATLDPPCIIRGEALRTLSRILASESVRPEHKLLLYAEINLVKLSVHVITTTTKAPKSTARLEYFVGMQHKAIDDTGLQGIYKLPHSWVIVWTTLQVNNIKCDKNLVFYTFSRTQLYFS